MTNHIGGIALKKQPRTNGAPFHNGAESSPAKSNGMLSTSLSSPRFVMPNNNERKRITLIVSATLDHNIELFSLATGRMKTDIVVTALSEFLQRHNVDPNQDRRTAVRDLLQVSASVGH